MIVKAEVPSSSQGKSGSIPLAFVYTEYFWSLECGKLMSPQWTQFVLHVLFKMQTEMFSRFASHQGYEEHFGRCVFISGLWMHSFIQWHFDIDGHQAGAWMGFWEECSLAPCRLKWMKGDHDGSSHGSPYAPARRHPTCQGWTRFTPCLFRAGDPRYAPYDTLRLAGGRFFFYYIKAGKKDGKKGKWILDHLLFL